MINNKKSLAVILARRGSVGLPGKNYAILNGLPCFLWSVLAAEKSRHIDIVAVSSCCPRVKEAWDSHEFNDKSIFIDRPEVLNGPLIKNEDVLTHSLEYCENYFDTDIGYVITLQPTSPIRYNNLIDKCIDKLENESADSLLTVSRHHPFIWHDLDGLAYSPNSYYRNRPMRQDLLEKEFIFIDNGNIYITGSEILINNNNRLGGKIVMFETDKYQGLQIDEKDDFELIERICKIKGNII